MNTAIELFFRKGAPPRQRRRRARHLLWSLLVLLTFSACAKKSMGSASAPASMDMGGAMMAEEAAAEGMNYGGGEMYARREMSAGVEMERAEMDMADDVMMDAPPAPSPSASSVAPEPRPEPDGKSDPAGTNDEGHQRQIIYTATMRVGVFNVEEAVARAELLPEKYGGWVHARRNDYVQMKIPAARLEEVMAAVAKIGRVEDRQLDAQDVTAEFVDLQSRLKVLRRTQKQLLELLEKAKTVEETLKVREALDRVTMELEVAQGRMRQLKNMIAFSTLSVTFAEQAPHVITEGQNDPFPWVDSLGVEATEWN